jgi:phosphohistidine phosphatase
MHRSLRGATVEDVTDLRRLIVMRHAKAEPFASTDHARRLTDRGRAGARDAGAHLRDEGVVPDYAVVSSAQRTRDTWVEVAEAAGADCPVDFDDALFTGSADVVVDALRDCPADARTVMFVGHNPTAAYLCHHLDDGEGHPEAVSGLLKGFPPCALAVLEIAVPWSELGAETGRVVGFYVGAA